MTKMLLYQNSNQMLLIF